MSALAAVIKATMPRCPDPEGWAEAFASAFGENPPGDLAMFFAQVGHESSDLTHLEEDLHYRSADRIKAIFPKSTRGLEGAALQALARNPERLANVVYAFKGGNGNSLSGDGWRFRGRGPFQITTRDNYVELAKYIGIDVVKCPDLLCKDRRVAAASAVWYWRAHVTDGASIDRVTRQINGVAMAGLADRRGRYLAGGGKVVA